MKSLDKFMKDAESRGYKLKIPGSIFRVFFNGTIYNVQINIPPSQYDPALGFLLPGLIANTSNPSLDQAIASAIASALAYERSLTR